MKYFVLFLLLAVGPLSGCSFYQVDSKGTTPDFYEPKKSIDDVAYLEKIDQPYEEIGVVTVITERRQTLEDVLPKLKNEAAILGGDAITDIQTDADVLWKKVKPHKLFGNAYTRAKYTAKVVVLK